MRPETVGGAGEDEEVNEHSGEEGEGEEVNQYSGGKKRARR